MFESREDLSFGVNTARSGADVMTSQLDRYLMVEVPVGPAGAVDLPHTAAAEQLHDTVCTNVRSGCEAAVGSLDACSATGRKVEDRICTAYPCKERLELLAQVPIGAREPRTGSRPLLGR